MGWTNDLREPLASYLYDVSSTSNHVYTTNLISFHMSISRCWKREPYSTSGKEQNAITFAVGYPMVVQILGHKHGSRPTFPTLTDFSLV